MTESKSILIVEDDQILVGMYKKILMNHGYKVNSSPNGEEGLKTALENHPDIILLDIRMPKMDGLTVMEKLRANEWGENVPIIIFTNLEANDEILQKVVVGEPSYYLVKSNTRPQMILEKVTKILENNNNGEDTPN